ERSAAGVSAEPTLDRQCLCCQWTAVATALHGRPPLDPERLRPRSVQAAGIVWAQPALERQCLRSQWTAAATALHRGAPLDREWLRSGWFQAASAMPAK